jgi:hypothetical protein
LRLAFQEQRQQMISEEELLRIQVLKFMPVEIVHRFVDDKNFGNSYRDGWDASKKFFDFLCFINQTQLAKKRNSAFHERDSQYKYDSIIDNVLDSLIDGKGFEFVVGFFRNAMVNGSCDFRQFMFETKSFAVKDWFDQNGLRLNQMIQENSFEEWIKKEEKKCQ